MTFESLFVIARAIIREEYNRAHNAGEMVEYREWAYDVFPAITDTLAAKTGERHRRCAAVVWLALKSDF